MQGVVAAVPTPVDRSFTPVKDLFLEHCDWVLNNGCDGINVLGSTGEASSFDAAARRDVMTWAAAAFAKEKLMVGTGTPSLRETIALTEHADDLGYKVALVLPPYYYKPATPSGLKSWYLALHDALGSRGIRIYFYNFPQMTGITIPVDVISDLATIAPDRFAGIKDSSGDLDYCRSIVAASPSLSVFPSSETALQTAVKDGFAGCISATLNHTAPRAGEIWSNRDAPAPAACGEIARQRSLMAGPTLISGIKFLVGERTENTEWRRVLPPFLTLPEEAGAALKQSLAQD
ncbi:dihydrodipicolinate synthase family protein [Roseibium sp.]|uniref:dihydrodipicolinate synthase family protein n=1 Tax=Roseibium sp. TaxID=1936156 RepID=UPI003BA9CBCB